MNAIHHQPPLSLARRIQKTPIRYASRVETIKEFERRVRRLECLALPDANNDSDRVLYEREMRVANQAEMTYREALEHVIRVRSGGAD